MVRLCVKHIVTDPLQSFHVALILRAWDGKRKGISNPASGAEPDPDPDSRPTPKNAS